uniref:DUF38 domain-containing protein n=1 Tax=Panagrolaimus sp. JU765 TaxID=591449 RepID=A0AC34RD46_9BILA
MIGKESLLGLVQTFRMVEKLKLKRYVEFNFGEYFLVYEESQALLMKFIEFAVPYVKCIEFKHYGVQWYNVVFDILSKESKQKKLTIDGLSVVNDNVKTAFTNMVNKGVLIEFKNITLFVVFQLPPCNFECLTVEKDSELEWHFLKYIKCSFRKLNYPFEFDSIDDDDPDLLTLPDDFNIDYVQEIYSTEIAPCECSLEFFETVKLVFPNVHTLTIDLGRKQVREQGFEDFEDDIVDIKEAICQAPQEYIHVSWRIYPARDETRLIEFFDGEKIDENTFEWKMESNEKKTFKLHIAKRKKANIPRHPHQILMMKIMRMIHHHDD